MQQRVLVRARGVAAFRRALGELALAGTPLEARRRLVLVPTRAAAELFRQTLEQTAAGARPAFLLPDIVTRTEWLAALHGALDRPPPILTPIEREIVLARAARETARLRRLRALPFELRPGLVAAVLAFYDELKRRGRTVRRFARTLFDELRVERGSDRGSEGLVELTRVLGFVFLAYERGVLASGALDEHTLRARLLGDQPALPFDEMVVAVADHPSDPRGLWPADFDLIGRLTRLARLYVVVTDEAHDAGLRERLEEQLPGLEERRAEHVAQTPRLVTQADRLAHVRRDREEELRDVARSIRTAAGADHELRDRVAVVFQRPLPYLYLAQQVFDEARVPYEAFDALPLAGEPYAALLDLVLAVGRTGGTREAIIELLRSSLVRFSAGSARVTAADARALDAALGERRSTGDASTYAGEVEAFLGSRAGASRSGAGRARRAAEAAGRVQTALAPFLSGPTASAQVASVADFLRRHERLPEGGAGWADRHLRARGAVLGVLDALAAAFARHDDRLRDPDELTSIIHHAIEQRTFMPRLGDGGVHLVDAVAARFGEFDVVYLVGLVETDWPERPRRSIFFSSGLLKALGWPQQSDQSRAQQAAFRDLLGLARRFTRLSAFELEGDSIVALSPMVEEAAGLPAGAAAETGDGPDEPLFPDEFVARSMVPVEADEDLARWWQLRVARPPLSRPEYAGFVDVQPPQAYRVSRVDRHVDCPFKYFAESVLGLPEEREEVAGLSPLERGTLLHSLFERFYRAWEEAGRGAITPATMGDALALFTQLVQEALAGLPEPDRALERTRLLGSLVARSVAERVFELEADSGVEVTRRLLERDIGGTFTFPVLLGLGERRVEVRGKVDRIDVLADGRLRVVDYKLGRLPDLDSSLQVAVYAHCARQLLESEDGGSHPVAAAMYLAFGDDRRLEGRIGRSNDAMDAVTARASEFVRTVDRIEHGEFPVSPRRPSECAWCAFRGVCRKEYLLEDEPAAEPV